ncbi:putative sporulation protein YtxC [Scopulibacillus darangshiensis]|uniref:Putative sporulation protein YtxC n=1 Tax=Scopulibacillus darangshiensis TaxID=442528 RepID=A0A4R2PCG7_9BACL|nr:sporulation protein YtxC [Scopulibacillus darangshiensis]TCP32108.1 putative sporulation protein YtxC [Scopulibacillus darangshiensis]
MISVTFESRHEAVSLHTCIGAMFGDMIELYLSNDMVMIGTEGQKLPAATQKALTDTFVDFIINMYEEKWLLDIIESNFYFSEQHDQEAILDIVYAIFDGEKSDLPRVDALPSKHGVLREAIFDLIEGQSSFSFESLTTFRLTGFRTCLQRYVELAIDEYKLQQEYLAFVEKLRQIITTYHPLHQTIYVVDDEPFKLYDDKHKPINNSQSVRSFYPILKQWGIEAEPSILLSLISLAPKKVVVYTDRPDHGMMKTLQNVFEDRVCFSLKDWTAGSHLHKT